MKLFIASDIQLWNLKERIFVSEKVYHIIKRYSDSFGDLILCTRIRYDKPTARVFDITDIVSEIIVFNNFMELFSPKFTANMKHLMRNCDLVVGRFESFAACHAYDYAKKLHKPFFAEVMSDPWDGLWNHGVTGKIVAPYAFFKTKKALKNADYALYVTKKFLQRRYQCKNASISASNVYIQDAPVEALNERLKKIESMDLQNITLMTTAATYVRYKGQEYVIRAIPKLNKKGIRVKYLVVGEGSQDYLRSVAEKNHVTDQVIFTGMLPLEDVLQKIDEADIYIQPSLQEGLPRAVIEAMSRGCPAIGARTAGIPELIQPKCVFKRKSSDSIVQTILDVLNRDDLVSHASENFKNSKEYLDDVLTERRCAYYDKIRKDLLF